MEWGIMLEDEDDFEWLEDEEGCGCQPSFKKCCMKWGCEDGRTDCEIVSGSNERDSCCELCANGEENYTQEEIEKIMKRSNTGGSCPLCFDAMD